MNNNYHNPIIQSRAGLSPRIDPQIAMRLKKLEFSWLSKIEGMKSPLARIGILSKELHKRKQGYLNYKKATHFNRLALVKLNEIINKELNKFYTHFRGDFLHGRYPNRDLKNDAASQLYVLSIITSEKTKDEKSNELSAKQNDYVRRHYSLSENERVEVHYTSYGLNVLGNIVTTIAYPWFDFANTKRNEVFNDIADDIFYYPKKIFSNEDVAQASDWLRENGVDFIECEVLKGLYLEFVRCISYNSASLKKDYERKLSSVRGRLEGIGARELNEIEKRYIWFNLHKSAEVLATDIREVLRSGSGSGAAKYERLMNSIEVDTNFSADNAFLYTLDTAHQDATPQIIASDFIKNRQTHGRITDAGPLHLIMRDVIYLKNNRHDFYEKRVLFFAENLLLSKIKESISSYIRTSQKFKKYNMELLPTELAYIKDNADKFFFSTPCSNILKYRKGEILSLHSEDRLQEIENEYLDSIKDREMSNGITYTAEQQIREIRFHDGLLQFERRSIDSWFMQQEEMNITPDVIATQHFIKNGITNPENVFLVYKYPKMLDPYPTPDINSSREEQIKVLNKIRAWAPAHYDRMISQKMGSRYLHSVDSASLKQNKWDTEAYSKQLEARANYALETMDDNYKAYANRLWRSLMSQRGHLDKNDEGRAFLFKPNIYGYPLDNMLLIKDASAYLMISVMPPGKAFLFKNRKEMNSFVLDKNNHEFILSHVSLYYQMSGVTYSGVEGALNALRENKWSNPDCYLISYNKTEQKLSPEGIFSQLAKSAAGNDEHIGYSDFRINLIDAAKTKYYAGARWAGGTEERFVETTGDYDLPVEYDELSPLQKHDKLYNILKEQDLQVETIAKVDNVINNNLNVYSSSLQFKFDQLTFIATNSGKLSDAGFDLINKAKYGSGVELFIPTIGANNIITSENRELPIEGMVVLQDSEKYIIFSLNGVGGVWEFDSFYDYKSFFSNVDNHDFILRHLSQNDLQLGARVSLERITYRAHRSQFDIFHSITDSVHGHLPISEDAIESEWEFERYQSSPSAEVGVGIKNVRPGPATLNKLRLSGNINDIVNVVAKRNLDKLKLDADTLLKSNSEWHTEKFFEVFSYTIGGIMLVVTGAALVASGQLQSAFLLTTPLLQTISIITSTADGVWQVADGDTPAERQAGAMSLALMPLEEMLDPVNGIEIISKLGKKIFFRIAPELVSSTSFYKSEVYFWLKTIGEKADNYYQQGINSLVRMKDSAFQVLSESGGWRHGNILEQSQWVLQNGGKTNISWVGARPALGAQGNAPVPGTLGRPIYDKCMPVRRPQYNNGQWEGTEGTLPGTDEDYFAFIGKGGTPEAYYHTLKEAEPFIKEKSFTFFGRKLNGRVQNGNFEVTPAGAEEWRLGHWCEELYWRFKYRGGLVDSVDELDQAVSSLIKKHVDFNGTPCKSAINTAKAAGELSAGTAASLRAISDEGMNSVSYKEAFQLDSPGTFAYSALHKKHITESGFIHIGKMNDDGVSYQHVVYAHVLDGEVYLYQSSNPKFQQVFGTKPLIEGTSLSKKKWNSETDESLNQYSLENQNTVYQFTPANKVKGLVEVTHIENGSVRLKTDDCEEIFFISSDFTANGRINFPQGTNVEIRGYTDNFMGTRGSEAISIHGNREGNFYLETDGEQMTAQQLVYFFSNKGVDLTKGEGPIHLLSCYAKSSGAAQALADETGRSVIAYSNRKVATMNLDTLEFKSEKPLVGSEMSPLHPKRYFTDGDYQIPTPREYTPGGKVGKKVRLQRTDVLGDGYIRAPVTFKPNVTLDTHLMTQLTADESEVLKNVRDLVNPILVKYKGKENESSQAAAEDVITELRQDYNFNNIEIINMAFWDKGLGRDADVYTNHWAIAAKYKNIHVVIDPTARQFKKKLGIEEPIVDTKNNWIATYQSALSNKRMITAKIAEVTTFLDAPFPSSGIFPAYQYKEMTKVLSKSRWYNQNGYDQYFSTLTSTEKEFILKQEGGYLAQRDVYLDLVNTLKKPKLSDYEGGMENPQFQVDMKNFMRSKKSDQIRAYDQFLAEDSKTSLSVRDCTRRQEFALNKIKLIRDTDNEGKVKILDKIEHIPFAKVTLSRVKDSMADTLYLSSHGDFTSDSRTAIVPFGIDLIFLGPHGAMLTEAEDSRDFLPMEVAFGGDGRHSKIYSRLGFNKSGEQYSPFNLLTAGTDEKNRFMDYNLKWYDASPEEEIKLALLANRTTPDATIMDMLTINKAVGENSEFRSRHKLSDILRTINEEPELSKYKTIVCSFCREEKAPDFSDLPNKKSWIVELIDTPIDKQILLDGVIHASTQTHTFPELKILSGFPGMKLGGKSEGVYPVLKSNGERLVTDQSPLLEVSYGLVDGQWDYLATTGNNAYRVSPDQDDRLVLRDSLLKKNNDGIIEFSSVSLPGGKPPKGTGSSKRTDPTFDGEDGAGPLSKRTKITYDDSVDDIAVYGTYAKASSQSYKKSEGFSPSTVVTHEAEHSIGIDVLINDYAFRDGIPSKTTTYSRKNYPKIENAAPAYQEFRPIHQEHIGTGSVPSRPGHEGGVIPANVESLSGKRSDDRILTQGDFSNSYRATQRSAIINNGVGEAIAHNQERYANSPIFQLFYRKQVRGNSPILKKRAATATFDRNNYYAVNQGEWVEEARRLGQQEYLRNIGIDLESPGDVFEKLEKEIEKTNKSYYQQCKLDYLLYIENPVTDPTAVAKATIENKDVIKMVQARLAATTGRVGTADEVNSILVSHGIMNKDTGKPFTTKQVMEFVPVLMALPSGL